MWLRTDRRRTNRARALDELRKYRKTGRFPQRTDSSVGRKPVFIDKYGTPCAVAYLMIAQGATALAHSINGDNTNVYIEDMDLKGDREDVGHWLEKNQISLKEAAEIQPTYKGYELPPITDWADEVDSRAIAENTVTWEGLSAVLSIVLSAIVTVPAIIICSVSRKLWGIPSKSKAIICALAVLLTAAAAAAGLAVEGRRLYASGWAGATPLKEWPTANGWVPWTTALWPVASAAAISVAMALVVLCLPSSRAQIPWPHDKLIRLPAAVVCALLAFDIIAGYGLSEPSVWSEVRGTVLSPALLAVLVAVMARGKIDRTPSEKPARTTASVLLLTIGAAVLLHLFASLLTWRTPDETHVSRRAGPTVLSCGVHQPGGEVTCDHVDN